MSVNIIRKHAQQLSEWSGGTTTQLYIYPENASYPLRNFLFRVSTATVNVEESVFTKLPGVSRTIMILDGELELQHTGHHNKLLKKFDTDIFSGDWDTKGFGKATDFNLMTTGNTKGDLKVIILQTNEQFSKNVLTKENIAGYYLVKGSVDMLLNKEKYVLHQHDFVVFENENQTVQLLMNAMEDAAIVEVQVSWE